MLERLLDSVILIDHFNDERKPTRFISPFFVSSSTRWIAGRAFLPLCHTDSRCRCFAVCRC